MKRKTTYEWIHKYTEVEHRRPNSRRMSQQLTVSKIGTLTLMYWDDHNHKKLEKYESV